jgi:WD40 repeat protein
MKRWIIISVALLGGCNIFLPKAGYPTLPCEGGATCIDGVTCDQKANLCSDDRIISFDTASSSANIWATVFDPSGDFLLMSAEGESTVHIYRLSDGTQVSNVSNAGWVNDIVFSSQKTSANHEYYATATAGPSAQIWDFYDDSLLATIARTGYTSGNATSVSFSPDGLHLAIGWNDGHVSLATATTTDWSSWTGIDDPTPPHSGAVWRVRFSPFSSDRLLATSGNDGVFYIFDFPSDWSAFPTPYNDSVNHHTGAVYGMSWDKNGNIVATASADGTIKLWAYADGSMLTSITYGASVTAVELTWDVPYAGTPSANNPRMVVADTNGVLTEYADEGSGYTTTAATQLFSDTMWALGLSADATRAAGGAKGVATVVTLH